MREVFRFNKWSDILYTFFDPRYFGRHNNWREQTSDEAALTLGSPTERDLEYGVINFGGPIPLLTYIIKFCMFVISSCNAEPIVMNFGIRIVEDLE